MEGEDDNDDDDYDENDDNHYDNNKDDVDGKDKLTRT